MHLKLDNFMYWSAHERKLWSLPREVTIYIFLNSNQTSKTEALTFETSLTPLSTSFLHETRSVNFLSPFSINKKRPSSSQGFAQSSQLKCSKTEKRSLSSQKIEDNLLSFKLRNKETFSQKSKDVKVEEPIRSYNLVDKNLVDKKEKYDNVQMLNFQNEDKKTFSFASLNNNNKNNSVKIANNLKLTSLDNNVSGTLILNLV